MTKYILHGGKTSRPSEDNRKFFAEMTKGLAEPVNVLCIYFAREEKDWPHLFEKDKNNFSSAYAEASADRHAAPEKKINFVLADKDIETLKKQIQEADVVYMRGGETELLKEAFKPIENFEELVEGKIVGGSSAGACVLSTCFCSPNYPDPKEGFGILKIKVFVHYSDDKQKELQNLESYGEQLPAYKIPEEKFFVIEV